jgi:hypothetical protein
MPICTICSKEKPVGRFFVRNNKKHTLHKQCKDCYKEQRKEYYEEHYRKYRSQYLERAKIRRKRIKIDLQTKMLVYLQDKYCEECGFDDIRTLEFDHIDKNKKSFSIARGFTNGLAWEDLLLEIKKCRILCANCNKIRTAKQQGWYRVAR